MTVVELVEVDKGFPTPAGTRAVLRGLDLRVGAGEIVAVVGRSGSGKTTLLTVVAGWESPDAGKVTLFGDRAPSALVPWGDVAIVPQTLGLLDELTVAENVGLPFRLRGCADRRSRGPSGPLRSSKSGKHGPRWPRWRALSAHALGGDATAAAGPAPDPAAVMDRLGVGDLAGRFPDEVSLGEQQRAALARAAVVRPRVLLADEPIAHQNQGWALAMMDLLREAAADGTACLLATHNEVAVSSADRVLELHEGRLRPV